MIRKQAWVLLASGLLWFEEPRDAVGIQSAGSCTATPARRIDCYPPVPNFPNVTEEACLAQGCCWKPLNNSGVPCAFDVLQVPPERCAKVPAASRIACRNPRFTPPAMDAETCMAMGCCFDNDLGGGLDEPASRCFQPFFEGYELLQLKETRDGWHGTLVLRPPARGPFANDIPLLDLHVLRETATRVHVRIVDPTFPRYEVRDLHLDKSFARDNDDVVVNDTEYHVLFTARPFGVAVVRRANGEVLFNSTPTIEQPTSFNGLIFENQFLEISTQLPPDNDNRSSLYGLGERWGPLRLESGAQVGHFPMFTRRPPSPKDNAEGGVDGAGIHPFYLHLSPSRLAHGVFFLASAAMELLTQSNAVTFRSTGGVLDFYVFSGSSPTEVTRQYSQLVGRPSLPPYWTLGYHFGQRRYMSPQAPMNIVSRLREAEVPLEVFWHDADYMHDMGLFSVDETRLRLQDLQAFIEDLHFQEQYYVVLLPAAVQSELKGKEVNSSLLAGGMEMDVFVRSISGERYAEKFVWPSWSVFIDFWHPNASVFWGDQLKQFHNLKLSFDGVWLDGNEPYATCDLSFTTSADVCSGAHAQRSPPLPDTITNEDEITFASLGFKKFGNQVGKEEFVRSMDISFPFDPYRQPFVPQQSIPDGTHGNLNAATLPMAAPHYSSLHYNLHSLYGHKQLEMTKNTLDSILKRRSMVISRSTVSGDGMYSGTGLHETFATWKDLRLSLAGVLQASLLGIPLSGTSICGYHGDASKELCIRWHQAAAFYPLFRNHGDGLQKPHSPLDFDEEFTKIIRDTILLRYSFLSYIYTQMFLAHYDGTPPVQSLEFAFPTELAVRNVSDQYMVGSALMVSPVVFQGKIAVDVTFPPGVWYDAVTGRSYRGHNGEAQIVRFLTPLNKLQLHIRGGYIIPVQQPTLTSASTKVGAYRFLVALGETNGKLLAAGELYLDDGVSLDSAAMEQYTFVTFLAQQINGNEFEIRWKRSHDGYDGPETNTDVDEIIVFGVKGKFYANSTLHVCDDHDKLNKIKANYFAHSSILVLSNVGFKIGDEVVLHVVAHPSVRDSDGGREPKYTDGNGSDSESRDQDAGVNQKGAGDKHTQPTTAEQYGEHGKGMTTIGIIGLVAGIVFIAGIFAIVLYRRRVGYNRIS